MKKIFTLISVCLLVTGLQAQTIYNSSARNASARNSNRLGERDYSRFSTDNIIYSGDLRFSMWGDVFSVGGGPIVGYKFNNYLSAGVRMSYIYYRMKDYNYFDDPNTRERHWKPLKNHYLVGSVWTRISPIDAFYVHAEFEHHKIYQRTFQYDINTLFRKHTTDFSINALMVGLGYKSQVSERLSFCYTVLYDILQHTEKNSYIDPSTGRKLSLSPYANTVDIRVGVYYNF